MPNPTIDIFSKGGSPWTVQYFNRQVLSSLLHDLALRDEIGIPQHVCDKVNGSLDRAVEVLSDVENGGWFLKHYYERLKEFQDLYLEWNNVEEKPERIKKRKALKNHRETMFVRYFGRIKKLKKSNDPERNRQFEILFQLEADRMDSLANIFSKLVEEEGDIFSELKGTVAHFRSEIEKLRKLN